MSRGGLWVEGVLVVGRGGCGSRMSKVYAVKACLELFRATKELHPALDIYKKVESRVKRTMCTLPRKGMCTLPLKWGET